MKSRKSNIKTRSLHSKKTKKTKTNIKSNTSSKKVDKHVMSGGSNLVAKVIAIQEQKTGTSFSNTGTFQRTTKSSFADTGKTYKTLTNLPPNFSKSQLKRSKIQTTFTPPKKAI